MGKTQRMQRMHGTNRALDVNCDLGETPLLWLESHEPELMSLITSANVACGGHAGDAVSMRSVCEAAVAQQVTIGAQVSYPDRTNFGRVALDIEASVLSESLETQFVALDRIARHTGSKVSYVKPHGALYNTVVTNETHAQVVVDLAQRHDVALFGLVDSCTATRAQQQGVRFVSEWFADRGYLPNGQLVPRSLPHALITEPQDIYARVTKLVNEGLVDTVDITKGASSETTSTIAVHAETICVHSDTPGAAHLLHAVRAALIDSGITAHAF